MLSPKVFDLIEGDETILERYPLETLSAEGELAAYKHDGFWQCMDTLKEKKYARRYVGKRQRTVEGMG